MYLAFVPGVPNSSTCRASHFKVLYFCILDIKKIDTIGNFQSRSFEARAWGHAEKKKSKF